jgi:hypothetical protein
MRTAIMAPQTGTFEQARQRVRDALAAMGSGDPQPYIDCWAEPADATLFDLY